MNIDDAYQVLEVDPKSSKETVRQHYLDLAAVWHPDRHSHNPRLQKIAAQKMKQINAAYDFYCNNLHSNDAPDNSDTVIIPCANCGTKNRLKIALAPIAKCGNCGDQLIRRSSDERVPCGDDSCIGTIGAHGRCNYCGKTAEEGRKSNSRMPDGDKAEPSRPGGRDINKIRGRLILAAVVFGVVFLFVYANDRENKTKPVMKSPPLTAPSYSPAPRKTAEIPPPVQRISLRGQPLQIQNVSINTKNLTKVEVVKIQTTLSTLGYSPVSGTSYLNTLRQYCADFGYSPSESFPNDFFSHSELHVDVTNEIPDWKEIYLDDGFENWINNLPAEYRVKLLARGLDKPNILILLATKYKFHKNNPLPQSLPKTGIIKKSFREGIARFSIVTRETGDNHYIKLINKITKKEIFTAFIRKGDTFNIDLPLGTYGLTYATGETWYGPQYLFGAQSRYARAKDDFTFSKTGNMIDRWTVELFRQKGGNLETESLSELDF
jgi:hypothetical protein